MPPVSPAVAQWELATRLRRQRNAKGVRAQTLSDHLGVSRNYWSLVENERSYISDEMLRLSGHHLQFRADEIDELAELNRVAKEPRWWTKYETILDPDVMQLLGLEYGAESISSFEVSLVMGLLQTENYARAIIGADPTGSEVRVEQRVELRLKRQERLSGDDRLRLTALMSEAAIMQVYGSPHVLREQLQHLVALGQDPNKSIELRLSPFDRTPLGMVGASTFHLMSFASPHLQDLTWREAVTPMGITDDPDEVEALSQSYAKALNQSSLSHDETIEQIERRIERLG